MSKSSKSLLPFFFCFALAHLALDGILVSIWEKDVLHNVWMLHPNIGNSMIENLLTWSVDTLNFPLVVPTSPTQGWFYNFLENLLGDWQFLLVPLNSLLWSLVATASWSKFRRKPLAVAASVSSDAEGKTWPPPPKM